MLRQSRTFFTLLVFVTGFVFTSPNYTQADSRQAKIGAEFVDSYFMKTCPEYARRPEPILKNLKEAYEMMLREESVDVNKLIAIGEKKFSCGEYEPNSKDQRFLKSLREDIEIFSMMYTAETIGTERQRQMADNLLLIGQVRDLIDELRRNKPQEIKSTK